MAQTPTQNYDVSRQSSVETLNMRKSLESIESKQEHVEQPHVASDPISQIRAFLENHPLFKFVPDKKFIDKLAEELTPRMFARNDPIIRRGTIGHAMFFTWRGEVEVISEDGETVFDIIKESSFFGEVGLLFAVPRTATVRAGFSKSGRVVLLTLLKDRFNQMLREWPEVAEHIRLEAEERFAMFRKREEKGMNLGIGEEIKLDITGTDLGQIPLFRHCEVGFLHMLALTLKPLRYKSQEYIVKIGDIGDSMYIIVRGSAEVLFHPNNDTQAIPTKVAELRAGSFFGEVGLLFSMPRTASVKAISEPFECIALKKEDMDKILVDYPEVASRIAQEAEERLLLSKTRKEMSESKGLTSSVLGGDVDFEVTREKLKKIPLFINCEIGFLHSLALKMKVQEFKAGTTIITKDDIGYDCFFVFNGVVEIYSVNEETKQPVVYAELGVGAYFGEVSLFYEVRRTASARAGKDGCTLYVLSKKDMQRVLREYPEIETRMTNEAAVNLERAKKRRDDIIQLVQQVKTTSISKLDDAGVSVEKFEVEAVEQNLRKVPFFQNLHVGLLRNLALQTEVRSYPMYNMMKKDFSKSLDPHLIFKKGDPAFEMFFIINGEAEILSSDEVTVVDSIGPGEFFGEIGLRYGIPRTATVRVAVPDAKQLTASPPQNSAATHDDNKPPAKSAAASNRRCDMIVLSADVLKTVLADYPNISAIIEIEAEERFRKARLRDSAEKNAPYLPPPKMPEIVPQTPQEEEEPEDNESEKSVPPTPNLPDFVEEEVKTPVQTKAKGAEPTTQTVEIKVPSPAPKKEDSKIVHLFRKVFKPKKNTAKSGTLSRRLSLTSSKSQQSIKKRLSKVLDYPVNHDVLHVENILLLDPYILEMFFCYLDPLSLFKCTQVCQKFRFLLIPPPNNLMKQRPSKGETIKETLREKQAKRRSKLWKHLNFYSLRNQVDFKMLRMVVLESPALNLITELNLSYCWNLEDDDILNLSKFCQNIEVLILSDCWKLTDAAICAIGTNNLNRLKHVDFSHCGKITGIGTGTPLPKKGAKQAPVSKWNIPSFRLLGVGCPMLETAKFAHCKQISSDPIETLVSHCCDIKDLRLARCVRVLDNAVLSMVRYCTFLTKLDLSDCEQLSDRSLQYLASGCPRLVYLSISFCKQITDNGISYLGSSQGIEIVPNPSAGGYKSITQPRAFVSLDFTGCILLSDIAINKLNPANLKNLKYISFRLCRNVTDLTVKYLSMHANNLVKADFTRCPLVAPHIASKLLAKCSHLKIDKPKENKYAKFPNRPTEVKRVPIFAVPKPPGYTEPKQQQQTPTKKKMSFD